MVNIFILDQCPRQAARYIDDLRISKMVTESCQMMANCFSLDRLRKSDCPRSKTSGQPLKHSHFNHPCSKWVRQSASNFAWLYLHTVEMERERMRRNMQPHYCNLFLNWVERLSPAEMGWERGVIIHSVTPLRLGVSDFAVAVKSGALCRQRVHNFDRLNITAKYRLFFKYDKIVKYTRCQRPYWLDASDQEIIDNTYEHY